jgi:fructokinase
MSRPLAVVAGEALIDLVATDELVPAYLGGGPFNATRAVARLGHRVRFLGRISTDGYGRRLFAALEHDGVETDSVLRTHAPTTLAIAEPVDATTHYRFYLEGTSAPGLTPADARKLMPREASTLLVGTLGLVVEPMAAAVEELVREVADTTAVIVDPNCRPAAIADLGTYRARLARVLGRADVLKLSTEDLSWLRPGEPVATAARALLGAQTSCAIVTDGADGALVVMRSGPVIRVPAVPVQVVDAIGAGDAFAGGLIAWWSDHHLGRASWGDRDAVVAATRFASLVAARACERAGADPPWLTDLRDESPTAEHASGTMASASE